MFLNVLTLLSWRVAAAEVVHLDVLSVPARLLAKFVLEVLFCTRGRVELNALRGISPIWNQIQLWFTIALLVVPTARHVSVILTTIAGPATRVTTCSTICA